MCEQRGKGEKEENFQLQFSTIIGLITALLETQPHLNNGSKMLLNGTAKQPFSFSISAFDKRFHPILSLGSFYEFHAHMPARLTSLKHRKSSNGEKNVFLKSGCFWTRFALCMFTNWKIRFPLKQTLFLHLFRFISQRESLRVKSFNNNKKNIKWKRIMENQIFASQNISLYSSYKLEIV